MSVVITSAANPLVKELALLSTRKGRDEAAAFLIEGHREVTRAFAAGMPIDMLILCDELLADRELPEPPSGTRVLRFGAAAFRKISRRQGPDGVAARCVAPDLSLEAISLPEDPLVLVAEAIEKPGNIGSMMRTAAALGADAVVLADAVTDVFNPNAIRSSQGAIFAVPVASATSEAVLTWLQDRRLLVVAGWPEGGEPIWETDLRGGVALVIGSESHGLSERWRSSAVHTTIPMTDTDGVDSLNAATTAALFLYEAVRQREG